jgi:hypothetical protein
MHYFNGFLKKRKRSGNSIEQCPILVSLYRDYGILHKKSKTIIDVLQLVNMCLL